MKVCCHTEWHNNRSHGDKKAVSDLSFKALMHMSEYDIMRALSWHLPRELVGACFIVAVWTFHTASNVGEVWAEAASELLQDPTKTLSEEHWPLRREFVWFHIKVCLQSLGRFPAGCKKKDRNKWYHFLDPEGRSPITACQLSNAFICVTVYGFIH